MSEPQEGIAPWNDGNKAFFNKDERISSELTEEQKKYITSVHTNEGMNSEPVPDGELWAGDSIFIYEYNH